MCQGDYVTDVSSYHASSRDLPNFDKALTYEAKELGAGQRWRRRWAVGTKFDNNNEHAYAGQIE
jgi:hypothetical protein